jgi:hypothetical protein
VPQVRETVGAVGGLADHEASLQGAGAVLPGQRCGCLIPVRRHGGCLTLAVKTREIAIGLGLAVGALAGMFYDAVPKFSYAFIARMTIHYHYETIFPNTPNNKDAGFRAGRAAVTDPGAGSIAFPGLMVGAWLGAVPSQQALRSIVFEGWTTTAVRRRLRLIRQAMADRSSGRVHTAEDTFGAEKLREPANLIDEPYAQASNRLRCSAGLSPNNTVYTR